MEVPASTTVGPEAIPDSQTGATLPLDEYRLGRLADSVPQLLWSSTPDGHCDFVNRRWLEYTGVSRDEVLGLGWMDQIHPDDRIVLAQQWRIAYENKTDVYCEFRIRRHDGAYRWFDTRAVAIRDAEGRVVRWYGSNTDIEDSRTLRESLREEKERFTKLVATAPGVIHSLRRRPDGSATMPFASPSIVDIYGIPVEELSKDATEGFRRIHPADQQRLMEAIALSRESMTPWHNEFRVLHPQKGELWVEAHSTPVQEADGSVVWHGFLTDITARKRSEDELRMSKAQLLAALESSGMGTWIWDIQKDEIWWDAAAEKLISRVSDTRETQQRALLTVHPDDRAAVQAAMDATRAEGREYRPEFRIVLPDGTIRWITSRGHLERDDTGRPRRVTGVLYDTTDRKRAEEAQIRSQKMEALGTLAGGIAHDFNNLLLAISGNTRLAAADLPADHPAQLSLGEIERASIRASDLVRRILTFSRQQEPSRELTHLQPIVEEALKLLRATLPAMIQIRTCFSPNVPRVAVDATQIHQIIMNLATNSAHALDNRGGTIDVSLDTRTIDAESATGDLKAGRYARLSVSDDGPGMDRKTQERIFDPFFTTKPAGQGTGLGLSVVHGIVRSHDGSINVYSQPGKGTTFHIYLPAAADQSEPAQRRARDTPQGQGQHVLYVDDEESLVFLATRVLERLGYRVSGHTDPHRALQTFQQHPADFDVVVTDLSMPGMSGFDLAQAMRAVRADIPILLTSGYVRPEDKEAAWQSGIRDVILKPNTIEELGQVLERLFRALGRG